LPVAVCDLERVFGIFALVSSLSKEIQALMRIYQVIFRGGRVQNLLADHCSRQDGTIQFRRGINVTEFPVGDLLMIDELADEGTSQPLWVNRTATPEPAFA